ncbi:hypothetical protein LCGC14_3007010 [marine sediment metagenome]|uniref:Uncharacterized protein n=1 Tax=marine sediment metagenome TaxID=412755 RepID=A0A0F8Z702_9ZZZZ
MNVHKPSNFAIMNVSQVALVASAIVYMFTTFVTASDFNDYIVEDFYDKYYVYEDKLIDETDPDRRRRLKHSLSRLRAKICEIEPMWEECPKP